MIGMTSYQSLDERWEEVEKALKQFEVTVGLGSLAPTAVDRWLNITPLLLNKLSEQECAEGAYLLVQEATFVQSQINVLQSKIDWCNRKINSIIAPIIKNFFEKKPQISLVLKNGEGFSLENYFNTKFNSWKLNGIRQAFDKAIQLCKKL